MTAVSCTHTHTHTHAHTHGAVGLFAILDPCRAPLGRQSHFAFPAAEFSTKQLFWKPLFFTFIYHSSSFSAQNMMHADGIFRP